MNQDVVIHKVAVFVENLFHGNEGSHDWFHINRMFALARRIAKEEGVDNYIISLAALLHEMDDDKIFPNTDTIGMTKDVLSDNGASDTDIDHVIEIITSISFSSGKTPQSLEGKIAQDADRLEAIGAIAIARTFAFGGKMGRPIYDPNIKPAPGMSRAEYKQRSGPSVNHFYEKLLLLKDQLHTEFARKLAEKRHTFMEIFLEQFLAEWDGDR